MAVISRAALVTVAEIYSKLDANGVETSLYSFTGGADGAKTPRRVCCRIRPATFMAQPDLACAHNYGAVFKITPQ